MSTFFDSQNDLSQLDRFEADANARLQQIMSEITTEFREFLDRLLQEEVGRFENNLQSALGRSVDTHIGERVAETMVESSAATFQTSGDSLLGNALSAALQGVLGSVRGGRLNGQSLLRGGLNSAGRIIGTALGNEITGSSGIRLSRAQLSQEMLGELGKGQRNG